MFRRLLLFLAFLLINGAVFFLLYTSSVLMGAARLQDLLRVFDLVVGLRLVSSVMIVTLASTVSLLSVVLLGVWAGVQVRMGFWAIVLYVVMLVFVSAVSYWVLPILSEGHEFQGPVFISASYVLGVVHGAAAGFQGLVVSK